MNRAVYTTRGQKVRDFFIGFVGWFVFNMILSGVYGLLSYASVLFPAMAESLNSPEVQSMLGLVIMACNILAFLGNIVALILLAMTRYWIALGMLAAFATALALAVCAAVLFGAACLAILASSSGP